MKSHIGVVIVVLLSLGFGSVACGQNAGDDGARLLTDTGVNPDVTGPDGSSGDTAGDTGMETPGVAVLGNGQNSLEAVEVTTAASADDGLAVPTDIGFNPNKPRQLWIVNNEDSSAVVFQNFGTDDQSSQKYNGLNSKHFLASPAALAFGKPGFFATAQQTDEKTQQPTPADFMGPVLWQTDLNLFDAGHSGHMDMLHNSPLSSGIAWDGTGHVYWVFDGYHNSITKYDFAEPHPPGGTDHSDGVVRRYIEGEVELSSQSVPAHLDMRREESATDLYIADSGNNRIAVLETDTGEVGERIFPNYDNTSQRRVTGATVRTLIDGKSFGMQAPSGLELEGDKLFVSDNATSTIYAFDTEGELIDKLDVSGALDGGSIMGMAFGPDGGLFVATGSGNRVLRIGAGSQ